MTYLLYLDPYHLGDPLFVQGVARRMAQAGAGKPPTLLVHGSGEQAERLLEAQGLFPEQEAGVWKVTGPEEAALVERALRETNRKIVAALTDAVVAAVGVHGVDRSMMELAEDGTVSARRLGWVRDLLTQRVVPVLSTLVTDTGTGRPREAAVGPVIQGLVEAIRPDEVTVVILLKTNKPGLLRDGERVATVGADAIPGSEVLPDPALVHTLAAAGVPVLLTTVRGFLAGESPVGTRVG